MVPNPSPAKGKARRQKSETPRGLGQLMGLGAHTQVGEKDPWVIPSARGDEPSIPDAVQGQGDPDYKVPRYPLAAGRPLPPV